MRKLLKYSADNKKIPYNTQNLFCFQAKKTTRIINNMMASETNIEIAKKVDRIMYINFQIIFKSGYS